MKTKYTSMCFLFIINFYVESAISQIVDNSRGVDSRVDYSSMKQMGPWDDRNYDLSLEDLNWLSPEESELKEAVPVFYRVLFRQEFPDTPTRGKVQYPRSLLNYFFLRYEGYLIEGNLYKSARWDNQAQDYKVITEDGITAGEAIRNNIRYLSGDILVNSGAESAISVSPVNPDIVVAGVNFSGQEMLYSSDGGESWTSAPDLTGGECCDPAMDWSSDGAYVYNVTLGGNQVWFYRSDDNGQTWDSLLDDTPGDDRRELTGPTGALNDKEYIHVDRYNTSPFKDNIYITWHQSNVMQVAVSTDNGNTFSQISFDAEPRGIGSDIVTDANGAVYHFWPAFSSQEIRMNKSTDGGSSFAASVQVATTNASFIFPIPSMDTREVFLYTSADVDLTGGTYHQRLYVAWTDSTASTTSNPADNHARIQVAYSDDGGSSWTIRTPHETADAGTVDRWHQWLKVDKNGIVHVVYFDTRQFAGRDGVDMYHSFSTTGGDTWSSPRRLTSVSSPASSSGFEFGDYNGLDFGSYGNGLAIFSDNRAEGGASPDMDVYAAAIDLIFANGYEL